MRDQIGGSHRPGHAMGKKGENEAGDELDRGQREEEVPVDAVLGDTDVVAGDGDGRRPDHAEKRQHETRAERLAQIHEASLG